MKTYYIKLSVITTLLFASCSSNYFKISQEVLLMPQEEWLVNYSYDYINNAIKSEFGYYIYYCDHLYQGSEDLNVIRLFPDIEDDAPDDCDMFLRQDSLLLTSIREIDGKLKYGYIYYNSDNDIWETIASYDRNEILYKFEPQYEDEDYVVLFSNREEGIGYLIFVDKKTGKEYLKSVYKFEKLIKFQESYYVISSKSLCKIDNPKQCGAHDGALHCSLHAEATQFSGLEIPVTDNINIHTGFITNEDLFLVCSDERETYISKLDGNDLPKVFSLGDKFEISNHPTRFNYGFSDNEKQALLFYNNSNNESGILDICNYLIRIIRVRRE